MKLCILTEKASELTQLLADSFEESDMIRLSASEKATLDGYDAYAVLCGAIGKETKLPERIRFALEEKIRLGKRVFTEYCDAICRIHAVETTGTRFDRPVLCPHTSGCLDRLPVERTILDEQSNIRMHYDGIPDTAIRIAQYVHNPAGFYKFPDTVSMSDNPADYALFFAAPSLLVASFRLSNFASAKFAPRDEWAALLSAIVRFLGGQCESKDVMPFFEKVYHLGNEVSVSPAEVAQKGLLWMERADMLIVKDGLPYAVKEGLNANVYPDGTHNVIEAPRPDCAGELSFAYYMNWLYTGEPAMRKKADGLMRFVTDLQITEGEQKGMERWSPAAPFACYGDDAARGLLLPALWRAFFGDKTYLRQAVDCLEFLLRTTGSDGLRLSRTDYTVEGRDEYTIMGCSRDRITQKWSYVGGPGSTETFTAAELRAMPACNPSGHYNATYMASLLLAYLNTGDTKYRDAGIKGLAAIMAYYPETAREHSETQELCRLLLPAALVWMVTEDEQKRNWLYRIAHDLNSHRHPDGGFLEWDTGYHAICAGVKDGESSVLCENGDPVTDLLYSVNWLPTAVNVAYFVTGDDYFKEMRNYVTDFFCSSQIVSHDATIDGIWPRSVDLDRHEVYGVPNDIGWAPWSVETGWTVGEIAAGLLLGAMEDKVKPFFSLKRPSGGYSE